MKITKEQLIWDLNQQHFVESKEGVTAYSKPDGLIEFVFKGNNLVIEDEKGEVLFETCFETDS